MQSTDPTDQMFKDEYFGPILAVHVYDDARYDRVVAQMESFAPYALTGAIIAQDRQAIADARRDLRFAAGNFYVNDKPTGAVVGQQPFGGARASGTNDKAGAAATCCAGPARARSRRRSCRRRTTATRTWAEGGPMAAAVSPGVLAVLQHLGPLHAQEKVLTYCSPSAPSWCSPP